MRELGTSALGQRQLSPWYLDDNRHKVLGAIDLEVVDLHGYSKFGDGVFQHERLFQLTLAIYVVELFKLLACVVSLPEIELRLLIVCERDANAAELAVEVPTDVSGFRNTDRR